MVRFYASDSGGVLYRRESPEKVRGDVDSAAPYLFCEKDVDMSTGKRYNTEVDNATSVCQEVIYVKPICPIFSCDFRN